VNVVSEVAKIRPRQVKAGYRPWRHALKWRDT